MKVLTDETYIIKIGENAKDNWKLLDDTRFTDCYVFHLSHYPSPYVTITATSGGLENITEGQIMIAASECKNRTKQKHLTNLSVDYSERSNVEKGDIVGELVWKSKRKTKTVVVRAKIL